MLQVLAELCLVPTAAAHLHRGEVLQQFLVWFRGTARCQGSLLPAPQHKQEKIPFPKCSRLNLRFIWALSTASPTL